MERKDYKLEIANTLLKKPNHVRGAAKELGVNHMMVSRKLKELLEDNVVDYRQEGKNNLCGHLTTNSGLRNFLTSPGFHIHAIFPSRSVAILPELAR